MNFRKKIFLSSRIYYTILFLIPVIGMIIKNTVIQSFLIGENLYTPDFLGAIKNSFPYYIMYAAIIMIFMIIAMIFKNDKIRLIYVFSCNFIFTVLIIADIIYSRSFFTMPSAADILILKNFSGFAGGEVSSLLSVYDIIFFLDFIVLILFIIFIRRKEEKDDKKRVFLLRKYSAIILGVSVFIIIFIPIQAKAFKINVDLYENIYESEDREKENQYFSSIGFHIKDIYELISDSINTDLSTEDKDQIKEYYSFKNENLEDNEYNAIFKGKNVLFLQIESLESFVINEKIDGQEITPNINKLLKNGIIFNNIIEEVQGGNSSDADLMYTTGRLPVLKGSTFFRFDDNKINSLPAYLKNIGYNIFYTQAINGGFWNYEKAWKDIIGTDAFFGADDINMNHEKIGFTINDKDFIDEVYPTLKKNKEPFYSHVVLNSSHMPFKLKDADKGLKLSSELDNSYLGGYLQCVKYADTVIGDLLNRMEKDNLLENTVIVIIGDHTGLNKYYEFSVDKWHEKYPFTDIKKDYSVPLIISSKDFDKSVQSDIYGGQIDVMPTLSYLLGVDKDYYENTAMGRNLLNTKRSYALFRDGTIYGDLKDSEKEIIKNSYKISEKLFYSKLQYIDILNSK